MSDPIISIALRNERDVVQARQRARELASLLGFENQDQIRLATATSEVARNAFRYARNGKVSFFVQRDSPPRVEVIVSDSGPGIANLDEILQGRYQSDTGLGKGIIGTKRLMDAFDISTTAEGTTVRLAKLLPHTALITPRMLRKLGDTMRQREPESPYEEIERQNQELMKTLQALRERQEELMLLNRELEDTNRGVVALYAELDERADYLRRASELKTKFLSNVSHEFRTPLNSIISLSRLLLERLDGDLSREQEKQVRYIESSARDLHEMVNDLLDLAKVEAGKIKIRAKNFKGEELFSALKGMLKPLLADNNSVELIFDETADLPPLHTDEGKVSQILRNLISNAIKFTPRGSVKVCARATGHESVIFEVEDTGIGIPAEHHELIFREFSQVENPLQERHRGTGLGLPLCRNLAMLLGGRVWLESELGKGSRFFAEIPIVYRGESLSGGDERIELPSSEFHRSPVLILEDNPETAATIESYLRHSEFQAIVVSEVVQAEVWMARHVPVAVVADTSIGKDSVWGFVINARDKHPTVPLLATSFHDVGQMALAKGASVFLLKPIARNTLLKELRQLTAHTAPRRLLIVDDNEVSRYIVRELLDRPWLDIVEASCGSEAIQRIDADRPDAVILDLLMPDIAGIEVLRRLRKAASTEALPVLVYTSKTLSENERSEIEGLNSVIVRKEDVTTKLSARPFLDWLASAGLAPESFAREQNA
jgi:signal transduction histidine kinase/CheY-like chemotaxis protein